MPGYIYFGMVTIAAAGVKLLRELTGITAPEPF
jgi:hypothetical protein